jgi:hypothetical protein
VRRKNERQWKTRAKKRRGAKGGTQTDEGGRREMRAGGDSGGIATGADGDCQQMERGSFSRQESVDH